MSSSTSLQQYFLSPPTPRRRSRRPSTIRAAATSSPAPSAAPEMKVGEERLEARVEEREGGYWVLKEKHRAGINVAEKAKLEREPMKLVVEDGIKELARTPLEEIEGSKVGKDDIDVRLKWLGLFHRRKHH